MNGPEHYKEAERLLDLVVDEDGVPPARDEDDTGWLDRVLATAAVHAELATAAASYGHAGRDMQSSWARVLSGGKP